MTAQGPDRRRPLPGDAPEKRRLGRAAKIATAVLAAGMLVSAVPLGTGIAGLSAAMNPGPARTGLVTDAAGTPVPDAQVAMSDGGMLRTGADGRFPVDRAAVYTASKPGSLSRAAAGAPGSPLRLVLREEEGAVSLRFGGDVMFGRRFYEPGTGRSAYLGPGATAADHSRLLAGVAPLLADSDVTAVNLESPLVAEPYFPEDQRPVGFHPTKDIVFASALESAEALRLSGVDVVSLANNHAADALGPGITSTIQALDAAGVLHTGAGLTEAEAWTPAVTTVRGRTLAFIGCTTVEGGPGEVPIVAGPDTPGAARCEPARLAAAVRSAKATASVVTVMIHGETEYQREQEPEVRELTDAAQLAGARVVVNGHPHVVGGLVSNPAGLEAESMGNLLFDQKLWSTQLGYLLRVDVAADGTPTASTDTVVLQDFLPLPAVGHVADTGARIAAGSVPGSVRLGVRGATTDPSAGADPLAQQSVPEGVHRLAPGWWVSAAGEQVRVGQDLLWGSGSFDGAGPGLVADPSGLWTLGQFAKVAEAGACGNGLGLQLLRSPVSQKDAFATTRHRQQVEPGSSLTLVADVRGASRGGSLELKWYDGNSGGSSGGIRVPIPESSADSGCQVVRIDAEVPDGIKAAQPYLRLAPPDSATLSSSLYVDNVRLIHWAETGSAGRLFDSIEARPGAKAGFTLDAEAGTALPGPLLGSP